jgi:hydroxyethylthiazole kinase-like uncharacterized protein yjeF
MVLRPPPRAAAATGHKYGRGHVVVAAGGPAAGGAARLAARAALRIGAGLVTGAVPRAALAENAARMDAIMLRGCDDAVVFADLLTAARARVVVIGPGSGVGAATEALMEAAADAGVARVLDADALTTLAGLNPARRRALTQGATVLTPHLGEFARLAPDLAEGGATGMDKPGAARALAKRIGATVLLKGPDTVIAAPDGALRVHAAFGPLAAPWLATAGAGDALAGMIAGLLAQGATPLQAACEAAWTHAAAARALGPGLIAEDLPEALARMTRAD